MLIVLHILSALSSLIVTSVAVVRPSAKTLRAGAGLTALAALSGTVLVIQNHVHMLSMCVSGVTYLAFALSGLVVSRQRLARVTVRVRSK